MKRQISLDDIGKDKPEIITTSFHFNKQQHKKFKDNLKKLDGGAKNVTEVFSEFIKMVNDVFEDGGGQVIFEIKIKKEESKK